MSEFDQLGDALHEQLHAIVEDLDPSAGLSAAVDALPASRRLRFGFLGRLSRRRIAIAVPVPIAAIAAVAVLLFASSGPTSSLAGGLVVLPSGSIHVMPARLDNPTVANALLHRYHIGNIVVVQMTASCSYHDWSYTLAEDKVRRLNAGSMFLTPSTIAKGYTVVLAAKQLSPDSVLTAVNRFRGGKLPTCASSHGTGPGMGDTLPANRPGASDPTGPKSR